MDPAFFSSFLNVRISLWETLHIMPNLHDILGDLWSANNSQANVDELFQTDAGFGRRMQEVPASSRKEDEFLSESRCQRVKIRPFRDHLSSAEIHHKQLRHQHCTARCLLALKEEECSTLPADYYL